MILRIQCTHEFRNSVIGAEPIIRKTEETWQSLSNGQDPKRLIPLKMLDNWAYVMGCARNLPYEIILNHSVKILEK